MKSCLRNQVASVFSSVFNRTIVTLCLGVFWIGSVQGQTNTNKSITIVGSGGDASGSNSWFFDTPTRTIFTSTTGASVNINASDVEAFFASGEVKIDASSITVNSSLNNSTVNNLALIAGVITVSGNLISSGAGAGILVKSTGRITVSSGTGSSDYRKIQTNNGNIVLWSNSAGSTAGGIVIGDWVTLNSADGQLAQANGGGKIWLAGGSTTNGEGLPSGAANGGGSNLSGVSFGTFSSGASTTSLYSGGGDIFVNGTAANSIQLGISWNRTGIAHAGNGRIDLKGVSTLTGAYGIELGAFGGTTTLTSGGGDSSTPAIQIEASSERSSSYNGLLTNGGALQATGTGGISILATLNASSTTSSINLGMDVLAASGDVFIRAQGGSGLRYFGTIGKKAGTEVTSSNSLITIQTNQLVVNTSMLIDATGELVFEPNSNSFSSAITWPYTNMTLGGGLTGLRLGKNTNTANITINADQTIAGPITVIGGSVTLSANLTATTNSDINIKGTTGFASGLTQRRAITTAGGNILVDADSDANGSGVLDIDYLTFNPGS